MKELIKWEAIASDDFKAIHGNYMLRAEQMDKKAWWFQAYHNDEDLAVETFAPTEETAKAMAELTMYRHITSLYPRGVSECQYEGDDSTAMNCKWCGNPKWAHATCCYQPIVDLTTTPPRKGAKPVSGDDEEWESVFHKNTDYTNLMSIQQFKAALKELNNE